MIYIMSDVNELELKRKRNSATKRAWRKKNAEKEQAARQRYYTKHRKDILEYKKNHKRSRWHTDPSYRLRITVSRFIHRAINKTGSKGGSFLDFVDYSMDELRQYIEGRFEGWMTWNNQGVYHPTRWNDNDQSTWTWQLDHIIPQSDLPYNSMTDDNFKKCWALNNLRPISAKLNHEDGVHRRRHMGESKR